MNAKKAKALRKAVRENTGLQVDQTNYRKDGQTVEMAPLAGRRVYQKAKERLK